MSDKINIFLEDLQWAELDPHLPADVCRKIIGNPGDTMTLQVRYLSDDTEYQALIETAGKHCPTSSRKLRNKNEFQRAVEQTKQNGSRSFEHILDSLPAIHGPMTIALT
jgi:hypothetical protein